MTVSGPLKRVLRAALIPLITTIVAFLVAGLVVLLLSDRSGVVTGSVIDWDQQVPGAYD